jgi:hypothetical protein
MHWPAVVVVDIVVVVKSVGVPVVSHKCGYPTAILDDAVIAVICVVRLRGSGAKAYSREGSIAPTASILLIRTLI